MAPSISSHGRRLPPAPEPDRGFAVAIFSVVFPRASDAAGGRISVLAPLGMAMLGRRVGEHVTWPTPGGQRRLLVDHVLYQPEREGKDVA
jgi:hypothetical protein